MDAKKLLAIIRVRLVQMGLTISILMQATASALGIIYIAPSFFALIEKYVEYEGSLPPEEALSFFFSVIPLRVKLTCRKKVIYTLFQDVTAQVLSHKIYG